MRVAQIILISIILAACGSSKKVVNNSEKPEEKVVEVVAEKESNTKPPRANPSTIESQQHAIDIFQKNIDIPMEKAVEKELRPNILQKRDSLYTVIDQKIESLKQIQDSTQVQKLVRLKELVKTVSGDIIKKEMPEEADIAVTETTLEAIETPFDHDIFDALLKKHVTDNGNVDYNGFRKDRPKFKTYLAALSNNMPKDDWKREDVLAYWINAYNAFTIKLIINNYPINSIKDIKDPWGARFFKLGKKWYNLNEIEHKILRKMNEPRIHFAINCASVSCPQLFNEVFSADTLESQLQKATKGFLADTTRNEIGANTVKVSKIFKWFSKDFKQDGGLIGFLNKYSDVSIANNAKISYKDYDWNLNE